MIRTNNLFQIAYLQEIHFGLFLESSKPLSVSFLGYNVYKCHLKCVASSHYHCGFCPTIIGRKEMFFSHFKNCCTEHPTTLAAAPATTTTPPVMAPAAAPVIAQTAAPVIAPAAAATWHNISTAPNILMSKRKTTTCCFCSLQLKRKNVHMMFCSINVH